MDEFEKRIFTMHDNQEPKEAPEYLCPRCGEECETLYKDKHTGEVLGCDCCIEAVDLYG